MQAYDINKTELLRDSRRNQHQGQMVFGTTKENKEAECA